MVAFREGFGGVLRGFWWRFERVLMAFLGCFDGVLKVLC